MMEALLSHLISVGRVNFRVFLELATATLQVEKEDFRLKHEALRLISELYDDIGIYNFSYWYK